MTVQVIAFLRVTFQEGAWKQSYAEAGRITYKATQDHASVEVIQVDEAQRVGFLAKRGTKVLISGNGIHLPDSLR